MNRILPSGVLLSEFGELVHPIHKIIEQNKISGRITDINFQQYEVFVEESVFEL